MRELGTDLASSAQRYRVPAIALLASLTLGVVPAAAQDFFGLLRLFAPPVVSAPAFQPYEYRAVPDIEQRIVRRRPKVVGVDQPPPTKRPLKPRAPGEVTNPVPELLADSTLRRGDIVMFPDGPRVFTGEAQRQHALADFEPVSRAGNDLPPAARRMVANLRPSLNDAWSADQMGSSGKLAVNVETTGSVQRSRR